MVILEGARKVVLIKEGQSKKLSEQTMEARIDEAEPQVFQKRGV